MALDSKQEERACVEHFLQCNLPKSEYESIVKGLYNKPLFISEDNKKLKVKRKKRKRVRPIRLITLQNCKYSDFDALRTLWKQYIDKLLMVNKCKELNIKVAQETLLKADFHGASICVAKSNCKHMEGLSGTVVTETKMMFQVVTKDDKVVHIPKKNSVFKVDYPGYRITILGDQFCFKPAHRLVKKFAKYIPRIKVI